MGADRNRTRMIALLCLAGLLALASSALGHTLKRAVASSSHCTLRNEWVHGGDIGDKKDYSVKLKGAEEPGPLAVVVAVHNRRVIICSATITVLEGTQGNGYTAKSFRVRIGPHGGVSSKVTLPETGHFYAPFAVVYARMK